MLTLPLAAAGLAVAWLAQRGAMLDNIAGAALGYAAFFIIAWAYRRWRGRDGLGAGDAKLLAALGAWVGATGLPSVVLLGSLMALAVVLALRSFRLAGALGERVAVRARARGGGMARLALRAARARPLLTDGAPLSARRGSSGNRAARRGTRRGCRRRPSPASRRAR